MTETFIPMKSPGTIYRKKVALPEDLPDLNEGSDQPKPPQVAEKPKLPAKVSPLPGADERPARNEWLTDAQLRFIKKLIAETGLDEDQLLAYFGFESLDLIPKAEASRVIKALESKRRAA